MPDFQVYGIRHHGPGSARALLAALENQRPDLLLIEGPPEANEALKLAARPEFEPPVALLVYNSADLKEAHFYPFAEFSPEWQAIQFGLKSAIGVRFFDLPGLVSLEKEGLFEAEKTAVSEGWVRDPFALLASLAGFDDHERWWEATLEHADNQSVIFDFILDLMRTMRAAKSETESRETLLREAQMRKNLRDALAEGFQNIAVVCGAWHAPVLADLASFSAKNDAATLKGLKKTKAAVAWIPWTFERLATRSGYAAGVQSPAWYQTLWEDRAGATVRWLTKAARLCRERDLDASSAHIIDAARLAATMAAMRNLPLPGIEELRESAISTLGDGSAEMLQLIENQLVIGEKMGSVPPDMPVIPLQQDFEKQVKSLRLSEAMRAGGEVKIDLDLRQEPQLKKSRFLHRLDLLGLGWGQIQANTGREQSTFHEYWRLKWQPEFFLRLIEIGVFGNTIEEAATNFCRKRAAETDRLAELTGLIDAVLKADLADLLPFLLEKLENQAALTTDMLLLADTVGPLVEVWRYGSARKMNLAQVNSVLEKLFPRLFAGLPGACANLQEEAAEAVFPKIRAVHRAAGLFFAAEKEAPESAWQNWLGCLYQVADGHRTAPKLGGLATRLLFDRSFFSRDDAASRMQFELSGRGATAQTGGLWLEGFLAGSGLLLVHQPGLWAILDGWVSGLDGEIFREMLPLLRRTFSAFTPPERQKLLDLSRNLIKNQSFSTKLEIRFDEPAGRKVLPVLAQIFDVRG